MTLSFPTAKQMLELQATGWFDSDWYATTYSDVKEVGIQPAAHYLKYGRLMERDPSPIFPVRFYKDVFRIPDKFEPATRLKTIIKKRGIPEPDAGRVLKAANDVGLRGDFSLAIKLAETYLPENLFYSSNIIRANAASELGDRKLWLHWVNEYLSKTGVAPLLLTGNGSLFDQLGAVSNSRRVEGPLVSVLMPAFNAEKTIQMAITSLLAQTWTNLEVVVVDDCSTDQTWKIIRELSSADRRVRIFRNAVNVGPYVSKNVAAAQARGEWITGHDADDWAHPERLERQVGYMSRTRSPASLSSMLRMAEDGSFVRLNKIGGFVHDGACRSALISLMVKTQYFRDLLGAWDCVRVSGDSELLRRIERLEGRPVPQLDEVTMLCLDNPEGLTNHATLGYSETQGVSPHRAQYRENYVAAHQSISRSSSRISFPFYSRSFDAPDEMLNKPDAISGLIKAYQSQGVVFSKSIEADVVFITNFSFSGGNASSTIDEVKFLQDQGLSVALIHCPINDGLGKDISKRFDPWKSVIVNWSEVSDVNAKVVICRHPRVITSIAFSQISEKIKTQHCFVVKNNSSWRPNGDAVYDIAEAVAAAKKIETANLSFCAISGLMREELEAYRRASGDQFAIEDTDWSPTFDLSQYERRPHRHFMPPFRIGRHGRDGSEKWREDPSQLLQAYPSGPDFQVIILGGASNAKRILGDLPDNWTVLEFGSVEPGKYLAMLDAFIYFPHSRLTEAFGRTAVEAMLAAVPVILPMNFESTFGDLAIYSEPRDVEAVIRRISATEAEARIDFLCEVQRVAAEKFSSAAVARRLGGTNLRFVSGSYTKRLELSASAKAFRQGLMG